MDERTPRFRVVWSSIRFCRINEFEDEDAARAFAALIERRHAPPHEGPAVTIRIENTATVRPRMRRRASRRRPREPSVALRAGLELAEHGALT